MIKVFDNDVATIRADSNTNTVNVVAKFEVTPDTLITTMAELTASVCGAVKWLEAQ
jgi:hypothetical protein